MHSLVHRHFKIIHACSYIYLLRRLVRFLAATKQFRRDPARYCTSQNDTGQKEHRFGPVTITVSMKVAHLVRRLFHTAQRYGCIVSDTDTAFNTRAIQLLLRTLKLGVFVLFGTDTTVRCRCQFRFGQFRYHVRVGDRRLHFGGATVVDALLTALYRARVETVRQRKFGINVRSPLMNFVLQRPLAPRGHVAVTVEFGGVFHTTNHATDGRFPQFAAQTFVGTVGNENLRRPTVRTGTCCIEL
jgi:hypothetical protein